MSIKSNTDESLFGVIRRLFKGVTVFSGAGLVTLGLVGLMITLISDEFKPQDRIDVVKYDIHAKPDDIMLVTERTPPKQPAPIDVPPAPPPVDIIKTAKPREPISAPGNPIIVFNPEIVPVTMDIVRADSAPTPINRITPIMPSRAERSGHCRMTFDIGPDGRPYNVRASYCSQGLFERSAIRSVEKWIYRPEIRDGLAVTRAGQTTVIRFNLTDERGEIIPE